MCTGTQKGRGDQIPKRFYYYTLTCVPTNECSTTVSQPRARPERTNKATPAHGPLDVRLALDHDSLPRARAARDRMREPERKRDHPALLVRALRRPHNIWVRAQQ